MSVFYRFLWLFIFFISCGGSHAMLRQNTPCDIEEDKSPLAASHTHPPFSPLDLLHKEDFVLPPEGCALRTLMGDDVAEEMYEVLHTYLIKKDNPSCAAVFTEFNSLAAASHPQQTEATLAPWAIMATILAFDPDPTRKGIGCTILEKMATTDSFPEPARISAAFRRAAIAIEHQKIDEAHTWSTFGQEISLVTYPSALPDQLLYELLAPTPANTRRSRFYAVPRTPRPSLVESDLEQDLTDKNKDDANEAFLLEDDQGDVFD